MRRLPLRFGTPALLLTLTTIATTLPAQAVANAPAPAAQALQDLLSSNAVSGKNTAIIAAYNALLDGKTGNNLSLIRQAADAGDPDGQTYYGLLYLQGIGGVTKDPAISMDWQEKAARQGQPGAQYNLAMAYLDGIGRSTDPALSLDWLRRSADQHFAPAESETGRRYLTGRGLPKDPAKAADWLEKAAAQNDARGTALLANLYLTGEGRPKDLTKAADLYEKAAQRGYAGAQYVLGTLYSDGTGGRTKDLAKAFDWTLRAAQQGYAPAEYRTAGNYLEGVGVIADPAAGREWLDKAAAHGSAGARYHLCRLLWDKVDSPADTLNAVNLCRQAAEQGSHAAGELLSGFYLRGKGIPRDIHQGWFWINVSAAGNHTPDPKLDRLAQAVSAKLSDTERAQGLADAKAFLAQHPVDPDLP